LRWISVRMFIDEILSLKTKALVVYEGMVITGNGSLS